MTNRMLVCAVALLLCLPDCGTAEKPTGKPTSIEVVSPAGGEVWSVGSGHYVCWKAPGVGVDAVVTLEYNVDNGKKWIKLATTTNSGKFLWTVPNHVSKECKMRVSDNNSGGSGESESTFSTVPSQEVSGYNWVKATENAAFVCRDGAGAVTYRDKMWLLGGWNPRAEDKGFFPRICNNEVWSSTDGVTWTLEKPNTFVDDTFDPTSDWEGRHTAGYVVHKGKMWIVGGDCNQGHFQYDVWNSDNGKKWHYVNEGHPVPWGPRALHHTVAFKDKIWVMGGQTIPPFVPGEEIFYRDIWNTSDGIHWEKITPKEPYWPQRGMIGGSAVFTGRMWILGGGTYDTPKRPDRVYYNDVWSSADGVNWECHVANAPWAARSYHDVGVWDDKLWVMEGAHPKNSNDVWYSSDGVNWYELPGTPWLPRHAASVFVHDDALWMVAGNNMTSDAWKLVRTSTP